MNARVFAMSFGSIYPHYVTKVVNKGRTERELVEVLSWLTGYDDAALGQRTKDGTTLQEFFADADLNPNASLITGMICGVRVEEIEDPLMQQIRYMDKVVDEFAKGRPVARITRGQ